MKRLASHQPYFFPYIGYFSVVNCADIFVYSDSMQYEKKGWMNRNRIIGEDGNAKYFIVPVKKSKQETAVNEVEIDYSQSWENKIKNGLGYYRKRAPYYNDIIDMLDELFARKYDNLAELCIRSSELVFERLGIDTKRYKLSDLNISSEDGIEADEWGIHICKCFEDADIYVNAPGGKAFYDTSKYDSAGIKTEFIQNELKEYSQKNNEFIPGLSIIDVMMFNSNEEIKQMLGDYSIL